MRVPSNVRVILLGVSSTWILLASPALAVNVTIETFKDNPVYFGAPNTNAGANLLLDASTNDMSYIAFDLNSLPGGAVINSASFVALDYRTSNNGVNILRMADVPADWDESTLTWNIAAANYGAVVGAVVDIDPAKRLWSGEIDFSANFLVDVAATSLAPSTDADMVAALQADLDGDDGQVVFVMRGQAGSNRYTSSKEDTTPGADPPRLVIDYSVIPEPSTVLLLLFASLGYVGVYRRRR